MFLELPADSIQESGLSLSLLAVAVWAMCYEHRGFRDWEEPSEVILPPWPLPSANAGSVASVEENSTSCC